MPFIKNAIVLVGKSYTPQPIVIGKLAGGLFHTVYVNELGRAWAWGLNNGGQLGDNSITSRLTPVSVLGAVKTFCQIAAGFCHTVAIDKNGRAWAWGLNGFGQLGDNSVTSRITPVSVLGAVKTFCQIAAGSSHTVAIDKNGRAWGWGLNNNGQLGDNSITSRLTPVSVLGAVKTFCQIAGGFCYTVAIDKNGQAWGWGQNSAGQLGDNTITQRITPVSVLGATKTFCQIAAGGSHTVAIDKNGRAWGWGLNNNGQLGDNSLTSRATPVSVLGAVKTFCQIAGGFCHTVAIDKNGRAWGWGLNSSGQLGDNSTLFRRTPVSVLGATKTFCQIAAGSSHTVAIDKNGKVWAWGLFSSGQLGDTSDISRRTPVSVLGAVKTFCQIAGGFCYTVAIDKNGRAWGWGLNNNGQLGDNSVTSRLTPVSVLGAVKTFCQIAAGSSHTIAIDKNGQAWAWGLNGNGRLGDNSTTSRRTPVSVLGAVKTFCQIAAAGAHTVAIDKNGRAWAWGFNSNGQLGDNSTLSRITPVSVLGTTKTFCQITGGNAHTVAIDKNGQVWSWGLNGFGQLGDNSVTSRITPVSVLGATKTFCQILTGDFHTVAIDKNGRAWGWGLNSSGQLGNNSTLSRRTPVSVLGATKTFCKISDGLCHTVAIDKNGKVWAWGANSSGQLGDNTITQRLTPVSVLGATKTFCQIAAGFGHTIAIDKNGQAWGWGLNNNGQLGDNSGNRLTPVRVCNL
jgi:alpha-tubulin suppressor-like RCC1 family protein